jgi:hypothetical protein
MLFVLMCVVCLSRLLLAAKLVIVSSNCPPVRKSEIEYYAMLSKTGVHHYSGSEWHDARATAAVAGAAAAFLLNWQAAATELPASRNNVVVDACGCMFNRIAAVPSSSLQLGPPSPPRSPPVLKIAIGLASDQHTASLLLLHSAVFWAELIACGTH